MYDNNSVRENIRQLEEGFKKLSQKNKTKFIIDRVKELGPVKSERITVRLVSELKHLSMKKVIFAALRRLEDVRNKLAEIENISRSKKG